MQNITNIIETLKELNENDESFTGYIYKITNKLDGKFYIGKTKYSVKDRIYHHLWACDHIDDVTSAIHNAIRKYGKNNFEIETIDTASSPEELNNKEREWIAKLNARDPRIGYNIARGGEGGVGGPMFAGHKHSEETRRKMSLDRKGEKNSNYGNHWKQSDELKQLHRELSSGENNGMYGKHHSEEAKEKSRLKHIGKKAYSNLKLNQVKMLSPEEGEKLIAEDPDWFEGNIHAKKYIPKNNN